MNTRKAIEILYRLYAEQNGVEIEINWRRENEERDIKEL